MNSDPSWSTVNWIHLDNAEPLTIQRLGVRYRFHPLVVEDLVYRENRAKIDKYKTHMLITIPLMEYREFSDSDYKAYYNNYNGSTGEESPIPVFTKYISVGFLKVVFSKQGQKAIVPIRHFNTRNHSLISHNHPWLITRKQMNQLSNTLLSNLSILFMYLQIHGQRRVMESYLSHSTRNEDYGITSTRLWIVRITAEESKEGVILFMHYWIMLYHLFMFMTK